MDFSSVRNIQDNENFKIDELSKVSGEGAVSQRAYKQSMASNTTVNYNNSSTDVDGNEIAITTMKNIGDKTFFLKDGKWIESTLDEEAQKNVVKIKAFSDDYFNLAKTNNADFIQYLGVGDNVVFKMNGKNYEIAK